MNVTLRQCLPELLDAFVGDLCLKEVKLYKVRQSSEVFQTGVSDLGRPKGKHFELSQSRQVFQAGAHR